MRGVGRPAGTAVVLSTLVALATVLAGCGGHGNGASGRTGGATGTAATAAAGPVHVTGVHPRKLAASTPIRVTFDGTIPDDAPLPTLSPAVPGKWTRQADTATFTPAQAYPPDSTITVTYTAAGGSARTVAKRTTPNGSIRRVQQIPARLHYLPLTTAAA